MIKILLLAIMLFTSLLADKEVNVTATIHKSDYKDKSFTNLKKQLLIQAKLQAAEKLFGEIVTSDTLVENGMLIKDLITAEKGGVVHIKGDPEFGNGEGLGELKVKATAYATDKDIKDMTIHTIRLDGFTHSNSKLTLAQLKQEAHDKFLLEAVGKKRPSIKTQANAVKVAKELIISMKIEKEVFNPDFMAYKMSGYVEYIPAFLKSDPGEKVQSITYEVLNNIATLSLIQDNYLHKMNVKHTKDGFTFSKKNLKKIEQIITQNIESAHSTHMILNAKLIIPDSVKGDTVNIILNDAPYDAGNGSGSYKIKLNDTTLKSSEAEVNVIKDGDLRYVNLSIPFKSSDYKGNFTPHILSNLKKMSFSVETDTKSLIANIATINTSVNNLFNSKASLLVMNKYKEFTIENSGSGFTFSSKALKKIEQIITENIQATHTTHMILNTKLIIPDSVKGETVNIILNAAPYDAGNGSGSYKIKLNNITLKSSEAEVNVIKDGDLRYVNLSIPFRSSNYQGNFIPHILFNLSRMNFSVSDENGVYTTHIGYVPPTNAIKISMKQKKSTKPKKLLNISASKSGLIFNTKVLKKIEQSMESYTETRLTINAKLIIPDSIKGDTVNIILNAAPYDAGNGSGSYKIKLNNITLQSSEAEVKVMKDGDLRYVNLSIPFRSSNYQGNFIPYILPSLSMMNFSVSDDNSIYTLMIKQ